MAFNKERETAPTSNNRGEKAPKPKVWLNIGFNSIDEETGDPIFVSLPFGIGIDTMNPAREPNGKNEGFARLVAAKNDFMDQLQKYCETLDPGQEEYMEDLVIQIRRVEEPTQNTGDNNAHRDALSQLSFVQRMKAA